MVRLLVSDPHMWYSPHQSSHELSCKVEPSKDISLWAPMLTSLVQWTFQRKIYQIHISIRVAWRRRDGFRYRLQAVFRRFVMTVMCFTKYGFHTRQAYSRIGRTKTIRFYCNRIFARTQNSPYETQPPIGLPTM